MLGKMKKLLMLILVIVFGFSMLVVGRPDMSEVGIPYAQPAHANANLTARWLGVATLLLDDGETQIMTDGFISRPSFFDVVLERPIAPDLSAIKSAIETHDIKRLAAVMPLHSHFDHALDSADIARFTGADVLGSPSTANIARSSLIDPASIKIIKMGESYSYGKFEITFFESRHAPLGSNTKISGEVRAPFQIPAPYTAWKQGACYSIHIKHPDGSVLVQGSAGFIPGQLDGLQADVVFLGVGGFGQLDSAYIFDYVGETVHAVQASRTYIIHHDDFFAPFGTVEQSKLFPSFDKTSAFNLLQLVMPAKLMQPSFGVFIAIDE